MDRPCFFLSAVSEELRSARQDRGCTRTATSVTIRSPRMTSPPVTASCASGYASRSTPARASSSSSARATAPSRPTWTLTTVASPTPSSSFSTPAKRKKRPGSSSWAYGCHLGQAPGPTRPAPGSWPIPTPPPTRPSGGNLQEDYLARLTREVIHLRHTANNDTELH